MGYDEIVTISWGSLQNWTTFGGHFYTYTFKGFLLRSRYRFGIFSVGCKISNNYLGMSDIPDLFTGGKTVNAGSKPT